MADPTALELATTRVGEKVSGVDINELTSAQKTANILQALKEYSRHTPYKIVKDLVASGAYEYSLPTGWVNEFSDITQIEYPADQSQDPADNTVPKEKYGVYQNESGRKLRFFEITPTSGYKIRVTFTAPHSADASTIYAQDFDAVCALAAAFCCFDLARRYAQDSESFISADSVDRKDKSTKYLSLGKSLVNEFAIHFGLDKDSEVAPAGGVVNLDIMYPDKIDFLTHPVEDR